MAETKKKSLGVWGLVLALVIVIGGSVLFVGATAGWFSNKTVVLSDDYYNGDANDFLELDKAGYENLINDKKSFIVFIDQENCKTADNLQGFLLEYMKENKIAIYKMMFSEMKETSLHEKIKYYPSVAIFSNGEVVTYLRADADEDADIYNNNEAFKTWMDKFVVKSPKNR